MWSWVQAGRLIANLIVLGSGVLLRAISQAYWQALVSESLSLLSVTFAFLLHFLQKQYLDICCLHETYGVCPQFRGSVFSALNKYSGFVTLCFGDTS
jgi:hypothetical protein